jgi:hypothetical protein
METTMGVSEQVDSGVGHDDGHGHGLVTIKVNNRDREIHRGHQPVSEIKRIGEVPPADELAQVVNGKLVPLDDNGAVTIKGGEVFVSHPRDSGSS